MQVSEGIVEGEGYSKIAVADESHAFEVRVYGDRDGISNWSLWFLMLSSLNINYKIIDTTYVMQVNQVGEIPREERAAFQEVELNLSISNSNSDKVRLKHRPCQSRHSPSRRQCTVLDFLQDPELLSSRYFLSSRCCKSEKTHSPCECDRTPSPSPEHQLLQVGLQSS